MTTTDPRRPTSGERRERPRRDDRPDLTRERPRTSATRAVPDRDGTERRVGTSSRGRADSGRADTDRTAGRGRRGTGDRIDRSDRTDRTARADRSAAAGNGRPAAERTRRPRREDGAVRPDRIATDRGRPGRDTAATARPERDRTTRVRAARTVRPERATSSRTTSPRRTTAGAGPTRPETTVRPEKATRPRRQRSHRGRRARRDLAVRVDLRRRSWVALGIMGLLLAAAAVKLVFIQAVDAEALASKGTGERTRVVELAASRGSISDRDGTLLAFTIEGRALAGRPAKFVDDDPTLATVKSYSGEKNPPRTADEKRALVAALVLDTLGTEFPQADGSVLTRDIVLERLSDTDRTYAYLAHKVLPAQADSILSGVRDILTEPEIDGVSTEREAIRKNPAGDPTLPVVGRTGWDEAGLSGVEAKFNTLLTGKNGSITQQLYAGGNPIPNTVSDETAPVNGTSISLTLDSDLQYATSELVAKAVTDTGSKQGCAVVLSTDQSQVHAMTCYRADGEDPGNAALTTVFEPGSVNKVITFAAALEKGIITPETVLSVDGRISVGGTNIHDAWQHGPIDMTATGILAKSSNVGTLMLAQQIGEDAFAEKMAAFGLGSKTGFELYEEAGLVPDRGNWSATTFGNLPIGQGAAVTLLQLASMYQAIGNDGVRVAPTMVLGTTAPDGTFSPAAARQTTQVMPAAVANTLKDMLRATVQDGDQAHRGTGTAAAVNGFQVAGKTGTAQQIDPATNRYSDTLHTATFVGIVPADAPRYSIAVMLDAPVAGSEGGTSAAPLFHDIAAHAMRAENVPPSAEAAPVYDLYVGTNQ